MQQPTLPKNPTLYLLSLGCPKNRVDSEVMLGTLLGQGYQLVEEPEEAEAHRLGHQQPTKRISRC